MTEKRGRGRPRGSRNKAKPMELSFTRIKELFATCYTPAQQKKRFMALKPDQQFRLMAALEPKEKPPPAESAPGYTLVIHGLGPCPNCRCDQCDQHRQTSEAKEGASTPHSTYDSRNPRAVSGEKDLGREQAEAHPATEPEENSFAKFGKAARLETTEESLERIEHEALMAELTELMKDT